MPVISENPPAGDRPTVKWKVLAALLLVGVMVSLAVFASDAIALETLASREQSLRALGDRHPLRMVGGAFLTYVLFTGLSIPGATILTLAAAWFFGFLPALVLVSFASTTGATLAFLMSRFLLRDAVEARFGPRLGRINEALRREGAFYLFTLRLIPVMPFFVINLVMGLTPLKTGTYWWVSQLGMLPGTAVYVYAGSQLPSLQKLADEGAGGILTAQLFLAFALLGIFPIAVKKLLTRFRKP